MSSKNLFRIGGIAAIVSVLLMLGYFVLPPLFAIGALVMAVFIFALYRLFSAASPTWSLVGAVLGIGGAVILMAIWLIAGDRNAAPQNLAIWAGFFAPPLRDRPERESAL